jgi:hypothetical protein
MESDLVALLKTLCSRAFPDVAPAGTATPYITYQAIGGEAMRYGDGTAPDKRNTLMQVSVWSKTRSEALSIVHQVDDAISDSIAWQSEPQGEAVSTYEPDTQLYGSLQTFDIWATR